MGFELEHFAGEVDQEFVCSICMMVLENPMELPCEHVFCAECIRGWLTVEANCPVDRQPLRSTDLRPTPRYYRNLLYKLEIRCEMESLGCRSFIPMENVQHHLANCAYKPDAVVVCDKGCNMTMTRRDYQSSCFTHLAMKFSSQLDEMTKTIVELRREVENSQTVIGLQQEELKKVTDKVCRQRESILRLINKTNLSLNGVWKTSHNMNIDKRTVLEPNSTERFCWASAQLAVSLEPTNSSFKIRIMSLAENECIVIGLTENGHHDELPGRKVGSIGYYDRGEVVVDGKAEIGLQKLKSDDIIECGTVYQSNPVNDKFTVVEVYFSVNGEVIVKKMMRVPSEGFFPTIRMGSFTTTVPKVEYLYN